MNEEKIRKLIDHLKTIDERNFRMEHWLIPVAAADDAEAHLYTIDYFSGLMAVRRDNPDENWCGTAGCLAGHTCMLFFDEAKETELNRGHVPNVAAAILELEPHIATYLFTPRYVDDLRELTLPQAIVVLEHFLATGNVDWTLNASD